MVCEGLIQENINEGSKYDRKPEVRQKGNRVAAVNIKIGFSSFLKNKNRKQLKWPLKKTAVTH